MKEFDDFKMEVFKALKMPEIAGWLNELLEYKLYNWLLKQWFYFRYLVLKEKVVNDQMEDLFWTYYLWPDLISFNSSSFTDGQWNEYLSEHSESKIRQDWNTEFKQQYGKWYFKAKLDGLIVINGIVGTYVPAIWLRNQKGREYFFEIDIELFRDHFGYTVWWNPNGPQETAKVCRSLFGNKKLYRKLQKEYHLFLIDWSKDWIKFYINGILTARFSNEIHVPMQIICTKMEMSKTIIQK